MLSAFLMAGEFDALKGSLDNLRKNSPAAAEEIKADSNMMRVITQRISPTSTPWKVKLLAGECLLRAHILRVRLQPETGADLTWLDRAWEFITIARYQALGLTGHNAAIGNYRGADPVLRMAAATALNDSIGLEQIPSEIHQSICWLHAEVSVRLGDPAKMQAALEAYRFRPGGDSRTQTFTMMAACHTGDWALAKQLGKALEANPKVLQALHDQTLRNPETIDYHALLLWIYKTNPAPWKDDLSQGEVTVISFRSRQSGPVDTKPSADNTKPVGPGDWQFGSAVGARIQVKGAVAHWPVSFGNQIPLSGSMTSGRLSLLGYLVRPDGRTEESLTMSPDPQRKHIWIGELTRLGPQGIIHRVEVEAELEGGIDSNRKQY